MKIEDTHTQKKMHDTKTVHKTETNKEKSEKCNRKLLKINIKR